MTRSISEEQWGRFQEDGYLRLGKLLDDQENALLLRRIDDIMLGRATLDYDRMTMQIDGESSEYKDVLADTKGHKGATLNYRKIADLELDPLFLAFMKKPLFSEICARVYSPATPIAIARAMFMNKPAMSGTHLPWHHDRFSHLDREPLIMVWTALDPATIDSGSLHVIPGSHRRFIPNNDLTEEQTKDVLAKAKPVVLELQGGEGVLLHNSLLHTSGVNGTDMPRRAFSACYVDANTKSSRGELAMLFGQGVCEGRWERQTFGTADEIDIGGYR